MSNYSDPITATGSLISLDAPFGGVFDSLSVPITPTQDLHGYSHPWPGGGGVNKLEINSAIAGTYNQCTFTIADDGTIRVSGTPTQQTRRALTTQTFSGMGTLVLSGTIPTGIRIFCRRVGGGSTSYPTLSNGTTLDTATYTFDKFALEVNTTFDGTAVDLRFQIESGSSPTSWQPYENICPISGRTGLSVYVSPTQDQQDATTYAVDWTSEAGTVYGGTLDVVTGVLVVNKVKYTYTGRETFSNRSGVYIPVKLFGPVGIYKSVDAPCTDFEPVKISGLIGWSYIKTSMTKEELQTYLQNNSVSIICELATPVTYQLTPPQISMLVGGQNNVWVDTSAVITLIYRLLQVDRQTGSTSIGRLAQNLLIANQFGAYSKVILNVTEELYYEAGNDTGRTFELTCPFGTQAMANNILAMLEGFQYQPYTAERAIIDPAAELGDGVTVNGVYGGIFRLSIKSGAVYNADVSAPADEEIDHEYAFIPNAERKIDRRINNLSSELLVQADQISAKVSQTGGNSSSFSWQLLSSGFLLNSGNKTVFQANSSGITVTGQMNATSGYIGDGANGFLISSRSISNGKSGLSDSNNGVYIGTDGIALGPNFKVDSSGNLTANSGTFTGSVYANKVQAGGNAGYITGGQIGSRAISVGKCSSGINVSLGNADYAADVFSGAVIASYGKFYTLQAGRTFSFQGRDMRLMTLKNVSQNTLVMCVPFV